MADSNYITFRCPETLRTKIEKIAAENDRSLSAEIRRAMNLYVKTISGSASEAAPTSSAALPAPPVPAT